MRDFNNFDKNFLNFYDQNSLLYIKDEFKHNQLLDYISIFIFNDKDLITDLIGIGFCGQVFDLRIANKVIKIFKYQTGIEEDIYKIKKLVGKKIIGFVQVFDINIIEIPEHFIYGNLFNNTNKLCYLIMEKLDNNIIPIFKNLEQLYINFCNSKEFSHPIYQENMPDNDGDNFLGFLQDFPNYIDNFINFLQIKKYKIYTKRILKIINNIEKYNINFNDLMVKNFCIKNNNLCLIDLI